MTDRLLITDSELEGLLTTLSGARSALDPKASGGDDAADVVGHERLSAAVRDVWESWGIRRARLVGDMESLEQDVRTIATTFEEQDGCIADRLGASSGAATAPPVRSDNPPAERPAAPPVPPVHTPSPVEPPPLGPPHPVEPPQVHTPPPSVPPPVGRPHPAESPQVTTPPPDTGWVPDPAQGLDDPSMPPALRDLVARVNVLLADTTHGEVVRTAVLGAFGVGLLAGLGLLPGPFAGGPGRFGTPLHPVPPAQDGSTVQPLGDLPSTDAPNDSVLPEHPQADGPTERPPDLLPSEPSTDPARSDRGLSGSPPTLAPPDISSLDGPTPDRLDVRPSGAGESSSAPIAPVERAASILGRAPATDSASVSPSPGAAPPSADLSASIPPSLAPSVPSEPVPTTTPEEAQERLRPRETAGMTPLLGAAGAMSARSRESRSEDDDDRLERARHELRRIEEGERR